MIELEKDERILLKVRKHWLYILRDIFLLFGIIIAPFIIYVLINASPFPDVVHIKGDAIFLYIFFGSLWVLIFWTILFIAWTDFYLDILIITNKRLYDVEQKGLFARESSTVRYDRIQDITVEVNGIFATLFKFGDIHIQTAGEQREFITNFIPQPYKVKDIISLEHSKQIEQERFVRLHSENE